MVGEIANQEERGSDHCGNHDNAMLLNLALRNQTTAGEEQHRAGTVQSRVDGGEQGIWSTHAATASEGLRGTASDMATGTYRQTWIANTTVVASKSAPVTVWAT